jgi:hypothetical protein
MRAKTTAPHATMAIPAPTITNAEPTSIAGSNEKVRSENPRITIIWTAVVR